MADQTDNPKQAANDDQGGGLRGREAARVFALATDLHRRGEFDQAVLAYSRALNLDPANADIYNNLGVCLRAQGKLSAASACYRRALVLKPNDAGVCSNLGNTLRDMHDLPAAVEILTKAVRLAPRSPEAVYNMGLTLRAAGDTAQAITCFESAVSMREDYAICHVDLGASLMEQGDLKRGLAEYEWRLKLPGMAERALDYPLWDGKPLGGKTLLIRQEGGLGDLIMFARYFPALKERGANVVVECHPRAARFLATAQGIDKVIIIGSPLPEVHAYASVMSLPHLLGMTDSPLSEQAPYLRAPEMHAIQLPPASPRQVRAGLCWSPGVLAAGAPDRSCPLGPLVEMLAIPGLTAFSLQSGERAADLKAVACDALLSDVGSRLSDLADLAAAIDQLDLVICVDSATAHVAGALGKPTWVLANFASDWRWSSTGETAKWYPNTRVFRQSRPGNWDSVFKDVHKALHELVREKTS